jgi:hypothetical protein
MVYPSERNHGLTARLQQRLFTDHKGEAGHPRSPRTD